MMTDYSPPFQLTEEILHQVAEIGEMVDVWSIQNSDKTISPQLRRNNRIRTVQASLEIEHNTLSVAEVTAVIEGKTVLGLPQEIQEVRNAFKVYEQLLTFSPYSETDLLTVHEQLMSGLVDDAGQYRLSGVGIYRDKQLIHMAPPASQIKRLMGDLFVWLRGTELHPLVAGALFHYEFEFIHPFADGNGRLGRLWQTMILAKWKPVLAYLPVETVIRDKQTEYYEALREADKSADATCFVMFMLYSLRQAFEQATQETTQETTREKIIRLMSKNPAITQKILAAEIGITVDGIKYHLKKLKDEGVIRHVGSTKAGRWEIYK